MKVVNFFGAPGVGKSTLSLMTAYKLKRAGVDVEFAPEVVKEYIHGKIEHYLRYQNYIFATADRMLKIMEDSNEVEFAVTDMPLLNSVFYAPKQYPQCFHELVFNFFRTYDNVNFFINRKHKYTHQGRLQDEETSDLMAKEMKLFLQNNDIAYIELDSTEKDLEIEIPRILLEEHRVKDYEKKKYQRK